MVTLTTEALTILEYFRTTYKEIADLIKELFRDHPSETDRFYIIQKIIIMIKAKSLSRNPIIYETADVFGRIVDEFREGRIKSMLEEKKYIEKRFADILVGKAECIQERVKWVRLYDILNRVYYAILKEKAEEAKVEARR